jgi:hypothetical protein
MMKLHSPPVLYFHSVAPERFDNWALSFLTMDLGRFEDQMRYLQDKSYRAIFLGEWLDIRLGAKAPAGDEICLTFDDGLLDNWVYVFPIAKKYGMRITLFVCPELVDPRDIVRPNLEDVWAGRCAASELTGLGNLSWGELRLMQESGYADVQSHTMSHAKYPISDRLRGFYYGGFEGFYPILNSYSPEQKPFYMNDPDFGKRLPYGAPLFEETSAVVARKRTINPAFMEETAALASRYDLKDPGQRQGYEAEARQIHERYQTQNNLVESVESFTDFIKRAEYEITESKSIIEEKMGKPIEFLCWPHGDNSKGAHAIAREAGYLATTAGKLTGEIHQPDRIPRIGTDWDINPWLVKRKLDYKLSSHQGKQPYYSLWLANEYKNKLLKRT